MTTQGKFVDIPILYNDDYEESTYGLIITTPPTHGTATWDGTNVRYEPTGDYIGTDSFEYTLISGIQDPTSDTANVSIEIKPSLPPDAIDDYADIPPSASSILIPVLENDKDEDPMTLSITSVTNPRFGTATISGGFIEYVRGPEFVDSDEFNYTIKDQFDKTDTATVYVRLAPGEPCATPLTLTIEPDPFNGQFDSITIHESETATLVVSVTCDSGYLADSYNVTLTAEGSGNNPAEPNDYTLAPTQVTLNKGNNYHAVTQLTAKKDEDPEGTEEVEVTATLVHNNNEYTDDVTVLIQDYVAPPRPPLTTQTDDATEPNFYWYPGAEDWGSVRIYRPANGWVGDSFEFKVIIKDPLPATLGVDYTLSTRWRP